jgi:hypothetical protein
MRADRAINYMYMNISNLHSKLYSDSRERANEHYSINIPMLEYVKFPIRTSVVQNLTRWEFLALPSMVLASHGFVNRISVISRGGLLNIS